MTQSTDVSQLPQATATASSGSKGTVLLQTASAIARNEGSAKSTRVKFLFDNGSQRSYVTDNLKSRLGLKYTKKNASPQYIGRKNLSKTEMRCPNLVS